MHGQTALGAMEGKSQRSDLIREPTPARGRSLEGEGEPETLHPWEERAVGSPYYIDAVPRGESQEFFIWRHIKPRKKVAVTPLHR